MGHKAVCKRACRGVLVGALLAFLAVSGNALSQNVVERAKELLRQGKPAEAFELLDPAAEQLNDAESAYLLGIAALDSGKPGLAIIAFERALAYNPAFAPARAELVRALVATGETDQARVELARLANVPVPPEVREKLAALDAQLRQAADIARRRTRGVATFVQAEAGYDTNINTGANSQSFAIPLFGGATVTLNRIFQKQGSSFGGLSAGALAYNEVSPELRLFGGGEVRRRDYLKDLNGDHYSTWTWTANAGARWKEGVHTTSIALTTLENHVGHFKFDKQWGVYGHYQRQLAQGDEVGVFGQWLDQRHPIQPALNTRLKLLGVGWRHDFEGEGSPVINAAAYYGDDKQRSLDPAVGRILVGARASYEQRLEIGARLIASVTQQRSRYGGENVFFFRSREDKRTDASLALAFSPLKNVTVTPQYAYTRNRSNIPVIDFGRHQALVTVRHDFD